MSESNVVYPRFRNEEDHGLTQAGHLQVREDKDEYGNKSDLPALTQLSNLSDFIIGKLTRAEALSWVLQGAGHYSEKADSVTARVIAELIHEALEANEKQWALTRQVVTRED